MSVRPVRFNADGSIDVVHDELGHVGTIPAASFAYTPDTSVAVQAIALGCPAGCGSASTHVAGGGATPPAVQELFARAIARLGCPCSTPVAAGKPLLIAQAHAKLHAERMGGLGAWQVVGTLK